MSRIVIALGGNALGKTPNEQLKLVKTTAKSIVDIVKKGNEVVIAHGNGPQVGIINLAFDYASTNIEVPGMPFAECGAMSQGYIGYHLQQAINEELNKNKIEKNCATIITQVEVDEKDSAFQNPTKPVGMFYTHEQANKIASEKGYKFVEDAGRGYRRVVPSPKPISIVELNIIEQLIERGNIVITVGGGGIPVIKKDQGFQGIASVIDKDFASSKLASLMKADILLILTAVNKVYLNYNKSNQIELNELTIDEAKQYIQDNQFAKGSMLPKIEACIDFLNNNPNGIAIISSLSEAIKALNNETGTRIINRR